MLHDNSLSAKTLGDADAIRGTWLHSGSVITAWRSAYDGGRVRIPYRPTGSRLRD